MSTKKFEKLIDLIINEDQEAARALFHDIVVEKSRTIYESLIDEEGIDDEISAEETGSMDDGEFVDDEEMSGDYDVDGDEGEFEVDSEEEFGDEDMGEEPAELEDRLVDVEDKLDQLMAEFEAQMGGDDAEFDAGEEEFDAGEEEGEEEEDSEIMEAIELKKIAGLYDGKISSDSPDGSKKGPVRANSGQTGMASKPVNFDQGGQTATPTSTPKPSNYGTKGESQVKDATQWENRPAGDAGKSAFTKKADRQYGQKDTDSGKLVGADGSIATDKRSPVPESRRTTKRRI